MGLKYRTSLSLGDKLFSRYMGYEVHVFDLTDRSSTKKCHQVSFTKITTPGNLQTFTEAQLKELWELVKKLLHDKKGIVIKPVGDEWYCDSSCLLLTIHHQSEQINVDLLRNAFLPRGINI